MRFKCIGSHFANRLRVGKYWLSATAGLRLRTDLIEKIVSPCFDTSRMLDPIAEVTHEEGARKEGDEPFYSNVD